VGCAPEPIGHGLVTQTRVICHFWQDRCHDLSSFGYTVCQLQDECLTYVTYILKPSTVDRSPSVHRPLRAGPHPLNFQYHHQGLHTNTPGPANFTVRTRLTCNHDFNSRALLVNCSMPNQVWSITRPLRRQSNCRRGTNIEEHTHSSRGTLKAYCNNVRLHCCPKVVALCGVNRICCPNRDSPAKQSTCLM
jgi:hypothetical protein